MIWFKASLPHVTQALASADLLSVTMNRACSKLMDGDACRLALGCELHIMSSQKKKNNINYYPYRCSLG